jgi:hypothetical protein
MSEFNELNEILAKEKPRSSHAPKGMPAQNGRDYIEYGDEDDDEIEGLEKSYVQWTSHNGRIYTPAAKTKKKLTPGVYEIDSNPNVGLYFEKIPVKTEGLLRFPDTNSDLVVEEIQKFWSPEVEDKFKKHGLTYKRGIILWGPPGSGKSCTLQLIMKDVIDRGGVVVKFDEPYLFIDGMRVLRRIQGDTPVVVIMEDIDSIIEMYNESEVLNILDGVNDVERTVFLATTNYPGRLGARIINRPSRFDKRFKIDWPSAAARRMYFKHIMAEEDLAKVDLEQWVKDTKKLSIAHLKELFINVCILKNPYEEAIKTLRTMKEDIDERDYDGNMGFLRPGQDIEDEE